jgi:hypothetical protein
MVFSGMLRRVTLVRTDVSEELSTSFIRATRICELGTTLALASNRRTFLRSVRRLLVTARVPSSPIVVTLMKEALRWFLHEPHGVTSQKIPFFFVVYGLYVIIIIIIINGSTAPLLGLGPSVS